MIKDYFKCGYIKSKYDKSNTKVYVVKDVRNLKNVIVAFFRKHQLIIKDNEFRKFAKIVEIIGNKEHLTKNGRNKIIQIKSGSSETIR